MPFKRSLFLNRLIDFRIASRLIMKNFVTSTLQGSYRAKSKYTKQSSYKRLNLDCFAPLAMTKSLISTLSGYLDCFVHFDRFDKLTDRKLNAPLRNDVLHVPSLRGGYRAKSKYTKLSRLSSILLDCFLLRASQFAMTATCIVITLFCRGFPCPALIMTNYLIRTLSGLLDCFLLRVLRHFDGSTGSPTAGSVHRFAL